MKKICGFLFWLTVLVTVSGCMQVPAGTWGTTKGFVIFYQVGILVRVINNCAPLLDLETAAGTVVEGLPYGASATVPLISTPLSGRYREIPMTAKGYGPDREYLGSVTRNFRVSIREGSREEVWTVDRLRLPGGRGGCR